MDNRTNREKAKGPTIWLLMRRGGGGGGGGG